jgi:integrase/recombinase XerD
MNPEHVSSEVLQDYVIALVKSGVKPVSIDSYIRGLNCFLSWLQRNGHMTQHLRIPRPRFELELPRTLNQTEIAKLVQLKPRSRTMRRVHTIALVCLDTGCRVKEVLGLRFGDVDLDAMVLRVLGKGRRERLVPFSPELRRVLFRWIESERGSRHSTELVFATRDGLRLRYDNMRRDYQKLLAQAGIKDPGGFHKLRHTFATEFIRTGRGEILLSRILGHTTLDMTRRYVQSNIDDLRGYSPLTRARA